MLPIAHPGVAYLLYAGIRRGLGREPPTGPAVIALVVGALLPDLIDQSLYYLFALPSPRTLAHSLLVAIPACLLVALAVRRGRVSSEVGVGFIVGYLSHPAADALWPFLYGAEDELGFLLWPYTTSPPYPSHRVLFEVGPIPILTTWIELGLLAAGIALWWRHGRPGLGLLRD